jgi:hypothetical protein
MVVCALICEPVLPGFRLRTGNFLKNSTNNRLLAGLGRSPTGDSTAIPGSYMEARALSCYSAKQAVEVSKQALRNAISGIGNLRTGDITQRIATRVGGTIA